MKYTCYVCLKKKSEENFDHPQYPNGRKCKKCKEDTAQAKTKRISARRKEKYRTDEVYREKHKKAVKENLKRKFQDPEFAKRYNQINTERKRQSRIKEAHSQTC